MCGPCTRRVLSSLWLGGNYSISPDSSPHSLYVSLSLILCRQHAAYDHRSRARIALMTRITLTDSIHLHMINWSIFRQAFLLIFLVKNLHCPTHSQMTTTGFWFFSQSWFFMWMSLHGHSFADHTKASDDNFQCIFQSTWGVRPWGSSSDISLSRTRLKKKKKRSKFDWKCSSFLDW